VTKKLKKMKTLKFTRTIISEQRVNVTIKNEEDFKNKIIEWCSEGQSLNFWDLEEGLFESIVTIDFEDPIDVSEETDEFYEVLESELGIDQDWLEEAENNHDY
jgi:hypothetical protein